MKRKLMCFSIYSVAMTVALFLVFLLLDLNEGIQTEKAMNDLLLAAIIGVMTSASLEFFAKYFSRLKGQDISCPGLSDQRIW